LFCKTLWALTTHFEEGGKKECRRKEGVQKERRSAEGKKECRRKEGVQKERRKEKGENETQVGAHKGGVNFPTFESP
jgi:hypothetical protein